MRIDKYLSHLGYGSRNDVKKILKQKLIQVNHITITDSGYQVKDNDEVYLNGEKLVYEKEIYLIFYKPKGVITSKEEGASQTVFEYIDHPQIKELFAVGRLDKDTTGVLLITNDGKLDHRLRSLKNHVNKVYEVTLKEEFDLNYISKIEDGIQINEEEICAPAQIEIMSKNKIKLILQEGKYHQVKRMMHACNNEVIELHRSHFADLNLDGLSLGEYRLLTKEEIQRLKK